MNCSKFKSCISKLNIFQYSGNNCSHPRLASITAWQSVGFAGYFEIDCIGWLCGRLSSPTWSAAVLATAPSPSPSPSPRQIRGWAAVNNSVALLNLALQLFVVVVVSAVVAFYIILLSFSSFCSTALYPIASQHYHNTIWSGKRAKFRRGERGIAAVTFALTLVCLNSIYFKLLWWKYFALDAVQLWLC